MEKGDRAQREEDKDEEEINEKVRPPSPAAPLFFSFITLKPTVEWYTRSMSLQYEPASRPLHISVKSLVSD